MARFAACSALFERLPPTNLDGSMDRNGVRVPESVRSESPAHPGREALPAHRLVRAGVGSGVGWCLAQSGHDILCDGARNRLEDE
jgi:hypothetical protein